jgi:hypothetical protein
MKGVLQMGKNQVIQMLYFMVMAAIGADYNSSSDLREEILFSVTKAVEAGMSYGHTLANVTTTLSTDIVRMSNGEFGASVSAISLVNMYHLFKL